MRYVSAAAILLAAACSAPAEGPLMAAGQDCLTCHDGGNARRWTAAGTFAPGAPVTISDSAGKSFTLHGNQVGNFYTAEPLAFPLTVSVGGRTMPDPVTYGGCNSCHGSASTAVSTGPDMLPGEDCMTCHGPGGTATTKFSAAGTFRPGDTIRVAGYKTTANSVGNFYFYAATSPISFSTPKPASVNGRSMEGGAPEGGCNRCHSGNQVTNSQGAAR
jgi:hypothetical protein